jgi:hypothetical protein
VVGRCGTIVGTAAICLTILVLRFRVIVID